MASTHLWIGNRELLREKVYEYTEELFGPEYKELIRMQQFYNVCWFTPEKNNYTRADLEPLFDRVRFALNQGEQCCIVLDYADQLTPVCANSLLKVLEEPPYGYLFILLAARRDAVLPTLQSRSLIKEFSGGAREGEFGTFLQFFNKPVAGMQVQVMQELEKTKMTEAQAQLLLDELFLYWFNQYKDAVKANDISASKIADRMMRACTHMQEMPPMPGSLKLFWKNLYLLMSL